MTGIIIGNNDENDPTQSESQSSVVSGDVVTDGLINGSSSLEKGEKSVSQNFESSNNGSSTVIRSHNDEIKTDVDLNLVTWSEDDPENPKNWSSSEKWWLTILVSILGLCSTFASSAPSTATGIISAEFKVSTTIATLITSLYLCGYVAGPLLWAPLSEMVGRRRIFNITILCYSILQLGQALDTSLAVILACRFFSGFFASAPLTNSGGVIADMFDPFGRSQAMTVFTAATFVGPALGPVVGSFIVSSKLGYRWVFWVMMMFGSLCWMLSIIFLRETFAPVLLSRRAKRLRKSTGNQSLYALHDRSDFSVKGILKRTVLRPLEMIATEPILLMVNLYLSMVYGLMYAMLEAIPIIWTKTRGFKTTHTGLIFITIGIGAVLSSILNLYLIRPLKILSVEWDGHPPCEFQLRGAMVAGPFLIVGIFWLGWTGAYSSIPWYVPAIAPIFLGMSYNLLFISLQSYLVEVYLMYSASALASNALCRSIAGLSFPLFTTNMFENLGTQWAATLVGCITLLIAPSPFIFYRYGKNFRNESKFAPGIDLKMKKKKDLRESEKITGPVEMI